MADVFVSIGSNVDRERNVRAGVRCLRDRFGDMRLSSVYESEPVGFVGGRFFNLVAQIDTEESYRDVIGALRKIEDSGGRDRDAPRFSPRTLDLDLILYGDLVLEDDGTDLPRREIVTSAFVLGPLAEIAGDRHHPILKSTYRSLWDAFDRAEQALKKVSLAGLES